MCYQQAIDLKPDLVEAYFSMAIILEQKACPDEAISSFQKAIQIKLDIYKTYNKLPYRAVILRHGYHSVYCTPSDFLNWSLTVWRNMRN